MKDLDSNTDGQLLAAFANDGDQAAFATLVGRHGAMVHGVCTRVLGDHDEARDVAQAVFLTLASQATSLRKDASVGGWLHVVASRLALNARRDRICRLRHEEAAMKEREAAEATPVDTERFREGLDAAISALPEKYRQPLVLFHLEANSLQQTAARLGLNPSTTGNRLARGREMLRKKLIRRGVTIGSVGALIPLLSAEAGAAVLPSTFVSATVQAASLAAAGQLAAGVGTGVVSAKVAALTKGAINMLFWSSVKTAAVTVAAIVTVAGGGALVAQEVAAQRKAVEQPATAAVQPVKANADAGLEPAANKRAQQELRQLCVASEMYLHDTRHFPTGNISQICLELSGKSGLKYVDFPTDRIRADGAYLDPWGSAYEIVFPTAVNVIARSSGKDRAWGTVDDVVVSDGAWGKAVNGLQAGLVPLGGVKGWERFLFLCPNHAEGTKPQPPHPSITARNRFCMVCGAPKPWSATFVEGEPMRMELHFRNLAKEKRSLFDAGYGTHWRFTFLPVGGGKPWQARYADREESRKASPIQVGVGELNEAAVELALEPGPSTWSFLDPQGRESVTHCLPPGKYTVTASYALPELRDYWHGTVTTGPVEIEIVPPGLESKATVKDGLQVVVRLDKAVYATNEPLTFTVIYTNVREKGNAFGLWDAGYFKDWKIMAGDWEVADWSRVERKVGFLKTLGAGEQLEAPVKVGGDSAALFYWRGEQSKPVLLQRFLPPGKYPLRLTIPLREAPLTERRALPRWIGEISTEPVEFEVGGTAAAR